MHICDVFHNFEFRPRELSGTRSRRCVLTIRLFFKRWAGFMLKSGA